MPYLFGKQQGDPQTKNNKRRVTVMMLSISMPKGIAAYTKSQKNHKIFKSNVINDIDTENRQCGKHHGQNSTMNSTGERRGNSEGVPINP